MKIGLRVIFGLIFAYGAFALGLAAVAPQSLHATPMWFVQVLGAIVIGLGGFGLTFLNGLPQLNWNTLPSLPSPTPAPTQTNKVVRLAPDKYEDMDNKYIYYLSARAKYFNDPEALKLLKHLERHFWCQHHGVTPDKAIKDEKAGTDSQPVTNAS